MLMTVLIVLIVFLLAELIARSVRSADGFQVGSLTRYLPPAEMIRVDDHLPDPRYVIPNPTPVTPEQVLPPPVPPVFDDDGGWIVQTLQRVARASQSQRWAPQPFVFGPPR